MTLLQEIHKIHGHLEAQQCIVDLTFILVIHIVRIEGNDVEILRFMMIPHVTMIVAIYRSPSVSIRETCDPIKETLNSLPTQLNIFVFNVNWLRDSQLTPLYNLFIRDNGYGQLVSYSITDNTCIDHIYTNLPEAQACFQILEISCSGHKAICA